jgi:hypothetical protein
MFSMNFNIIASIESLEVLERACKGNANDMGETCECCARDGLSRLTELLIPGACTFGVVGVPLDEDILPMYHDYNQNGEGYGDTVVSSVS